MGGDDPVRDDGVRDLERWFERRGLPHFVETEQTAATIWGRAAWLLVAAAVLRGLEALDLASWSVAKNVAVAATIVVLMVVTWTVANLVRRVPAWSVPRRIGRVELALFLVIPAVPAMVLGQWEDAVESLVIGVAVLALIYAVTSYGVVPLVGWAGGRAVAQLPLLLGLVVRALPLLLLFTTFLFINGEVWQVAGTMHGLPYVAVLVLFFLLGAVFVLSRIGPIMRAISRFDRWEEIDELARATPAATLTHPREGPAPGDELGLRQRVNVGLVTIFNQAFQITFVAVMLTAFFVVFGVLTISEATTASWTGVADVDVLATFRLDGQELVITEPLLRVAGFLGAFTGMYFTVVLSTDDTYRTEFADDVAPLVREALAARAVYRHHRSVRSTATEGIA